MTAYPDLEIGLHRWDAEAWTVDLRFNDPESDGFDSSATLLPARRECPCRSKPLPTIHPIPTRIECLIHVTNRRQ
jgi:hypothetical protein